MRPVPYRRSGGSEDAEQTGQHFDMPVLALYSVRDGKLARAQMFYFDTVPVLEFLSTASPAIAPGP